jgi:hypothetical protein
MAKKVIKGKSVGDSDNLFDELITESENKRQNDLSQKRKKSEERDNLERSLMGRSSNIPESSAYDRIQSQKKGHL